MTRSTRSAACVFVCWALGCSDVSQRTTPDAAAAGREDAGSVDSGDHDSAKPLLLLPPIACEPNIDSIRTNVFGVACGWDTCHSGNGAAWGLKLVLPTVEEQLLTRKSGTCPTWALVVPGKPEESFLWHKITASKPECGEPMPWGYEPLPRNVLACIEEWIRGLSP